MNINYKESQIDFLSQSAGQGADMAPPRYMAARISLSLENLVIFAIAAIMVVIFSFSLGIERGKRVALAPVSSASSDAKDVAIGSNGAEKAEKVFEKIEPVSSGSVAKAGVADAISGAYTLQVASYKGLKSAQREAENLKKKGFDHVYVLPKGAYTIVCVGNFQNKEDASHIKRQLNNRYQGSVVRRL